MRPMIIKIVRSIFFTPCFVMLRIPFLIPYILKHFCAYFLLFTHVSKLIRFELRKGLLR